MAKYTVNHACGHSSTVQLFGPKKDREWRMQQLEGEDCPECRQTRRAAQAERMKEQAEAAGLPELTGTERQCVWAEQLRAEFQSMAAVLRADVRPEKLEDYDLTVAYLLQKRKLASQWIEARGERVSMTVAATVSEAKAANSPAPAQAIPEAEDVVAEATVQPQDVTHGGSVEIGVEGDIVRARYVKDESFRLLVKGLGFRWNADLQAWERKTGIRTGSAEDRAAELGNVLLREGFAVTIYSEDLRRKAIEADFEPENKCWVTAVKSGDFCLSWPRDGEDYFARAKRLHGARWSREAGGVLVPPGSWAEVEDFARVNGFGVSEGAQRLIEQQKARIIPVVQPAQPKQREKADVLGDILKSEPGVLEDLTDD